MSGHKQLKEARRMLKLINRLIQWLEAKGMSAQQIVDCIKYITR